MNFIDFRYDRRGTPVSYLPDDLHPGLPFHQGQEACPGTVLGAVDSVPFPVAEAKPLIYVAGPLVDASACSFGSRMLGLAMSLPSPLLFPSPGKILNSDLGNVSCIYPVVKSLFADSYTFRPQIAVREMAYSCIRAVMAIQYQMGDECNQVMMPA